MEKVQNDLIYFNLKLAKKYGTLEAILLNSITWWIQKNASDKKNFREGRTWTYYTLDSFVQYFQGCYTIRQIRTAIDNLISKDVLMKGNFNKMKIDRTVWYALVNEQEFDIKYPITQAKEDRKPANLNKFPICQKGQMDMSDLTNGFVTDDKPITVSKPVTEPVSEHINLSNTTMEKKKGSSILFTKDEFKIKDSICKYLGRGINQITFDNWYRWICKKNELNQGKRENAWIKSFIDWETNNKVEPVKTVKSINPYQNMILPNFKFTSPAKSNFINPDQSNT